MNLCSRLAQDESIEAELKRIDALKAELRDSLQAAQLAGNAEAVTSIQAEYKDFAEAYKRQKGKIVNDEHYQ